MHYQRTFPTAISRLKYLLMIAKKDYENADNPRQEDLAALQIKKLRKDIQAFGGNPDNLEDIEILISWPNSTICEPGRPAPG